MITLYQVEWCPYCHLVRQAMTELGLSYTIVNVRAETTERTELKELSGQERVPVLADGDAVLSGADVIVEHLRATYSPPPDAAAHQEKGLYRYVLELDTPPQDSLARLKQLLPEHGFQVICDTAITPKEQDAAGTYTLLHVVDAMAVALDLAADPSVPAALSIPMAVYPIENGSQIVLTDPAAGAWLACESRLLKIASPLRERIRELFETL